MAYNPSVDFLALVRQTSDGARMEQFPGMDYVLAALARAGMFNMTVSDEAPTTDQAKTAWLKPASGGSWAGEGTLFLWNTDTNEYEFATPALWSEFLEPAP